MKNIYWFLFFILVVYFIFLIRQDIIDNLGLKKELKSNQQKLAVEEKRAVGLNLRSKSVNNDSYIEELARTQLGMIKKGETAYKVIR